jgi:integrase
MLGNDTDMPRRYQNGKLQIRKDVSRPYYFVRVTVPVLDRDTGKRKKVRHEEKLGFVDEITRAQAERLRAKTLEMVNAHRTIAQSQVTFANVARRFLDTRLPQLGVATQKKYRLQIKNHLLPFFGPMRMSEIDRPIVEHFLLSKRESLSWWSRVDLKGILSAIFTTARDWKLYEGDNPTEKVRIGKKRTVREKSLPTAEQFRALLGGLDEEIRFLVTLLFGLGLNISEALGLKWRDFDVDKGTIEIRRRWYRGDLSDDGELKTENRADAVYLNAMLVDELKRRPRVAGSEFLFVGDNKMPPDDRDLLRERFRPVAKRLGLYYPGFGWHTFRRMHITWRQWAGATPLEAMKAARHGSLDMTALYTLVDPERSRAQLDSMFDKLMDVPMDGPKQ